MKRKTKILYLIDTTKPGGGEKVLLDLVQLIDKDKFEVFVILPDTGWLYSQLKTVTSVNLTIINGKGRFSIKYLLRLIRFLKKYDIDIIHSHLLGVSLYSCMASFVTNTRVVCTIHGAVDSHHSMSKLKLLIISLLATKIIFVSISLQRYFLDNFSLASDKCTTIYNGVNISNYTREEDYTLKKELDLPKESILIGLVGNITPSKGYDILIKAAKIIIEEYPTALFLIAGDRRGTLYDSLLEIRTQYQLETKIRFLGFVEEVRHFLENLDIFVLSSISEGFSLSTVEAMSLGLPVVVTKCGGPEEIVTNNENGIIVSLGDEKALAAGVIRLLNNRKLRKDLGSVAMQTIAKKFDSSIMLGRHMELYRSIVSIDSKKNS